MRKSSRSGTPSRAVLVTLALAVLFSATPASAKPFKLDRSRSTGWWHWECKDGSDQGWSTGWWDAWTTGWSECAGIPAVDHTEGWGPHLDDGKYLGCNAANLEGVGTFHSPRAVGEAACRNHFGEAQMEGTVLEPLEAVKASLLMWGLFLGGDTQAEVQRLHNLSDRDFSLIARRAYGEESWVDVEGTTLRWFLAD